MERRFLRRSRVGPQGSCGFLLDTVRRIGDAQGQLMERKNESGCETMPESVPPAVSGGTAAGALYETAGGITINFHAAQFNRIDNLNDYSGNYRSFQSLDGIVTADMLHQEERRRTGTAVVAPADAAAPPKKREAEGDAPEVVEVSSPVTIISQGRVLIVATDVEGATACGRLLAEQGMTCTLLVTKNTATNSFLDTRGRLPFLVAEDVSITGAFGGFSAVVTVNGERKPLRNPLDDQPASFDLILDLQAEPSFGGGRPPLGYYAPGSSPSHLPRVLRELPEMRGRFEKPQFAMFVKKHCTHGRSRTRDCRRCLDVCPVGAIQSAEHAISLDHCLCQGCGGCALVCPTDAIRMVHSSPEGRWEELRHALESRPVGAGFPPTLIISDGGAAVADSRLGGGEGLSGSRIAFAVEQIGFVGLEMLLAALAGGAGTIVVACGAQNPPALRKAVERQMEMARAILPGLGMPADSIRFTVSPPEDKAEGSAAAEAPFPAAAGGARPGRTPITPPASSAGHDKRTLARLAAQQLYDQSGAQQPQLPLPAGSPFGALAVDADRCTLCMACIAACPSGALSADGTLPRLKFRESPCHQCGLCEEACPEKAIRLIPRLLCDAQAVEKAAVLREADPLRCIECGVPFASQAMITRMEEKLAGHWMYADARQLRRLRLCGTCRARDTLSSPDVKTWNR